MLFNAITTHVAYTNIALYKKKIVIDSPFPNFCLYQNNCQISKLNCIWSQLASVTLKLDAISVC